MPLMFTVTPDHVGSQSKLWGIVVGVFVTARCLSVTQPAMSQALNCFPAFMLGASCFHYATVMGCKHCNGCMGCVTFWLQGSNPPLTMTLILIWRQHAVNHAVTVSHRHCYGGTIYRSDPPAITVNYHEGETDLSRFRVWWNSSSL